MKRRLFILFFTVCLTVFFHYFNLHAIMRLEKESQRLDDQLEAEKISNRELWLDFNRLSSRDRICPLAAEQLGMVFPTPQNQYVYTIRESRVNDKERAYSLIDFFIPTAEALTGDIH